MKVVCILPLPCGCVAERDDIGKYFSVLECPWCGATFFEKDFRRWLKITSPDVFIERQAQMVKVGKGLVEIVSRCECGSLLARLRGGYRTFHFVPWRIEEVTN